MQVPKKKPGKRTIRTYPRKVDPVANAKKVAARIELRNDIVNAQVLANYRNEFDRLEGYRSGSLAAETIDARQKKLKELARKVVAPDLHPVLRM